MSELVWVKDNGSDTPRVWFDLRNEGDYKQYGYVLTYQDRGDFWHVMYNFRTADGSGIPSESIHKTEARTTEDIRELLKMKYLLLRRPQ